MPFLVYLLLLFVFSLNESRAQTARQIQMTPTLVYASDFSEATGAGVEVTVELSNLSEIDQAGQTFLYNENVRIISFVRNPSTHGTAHWGTWGGGMYFLLPSLENSFVPARSSFVGQARNFTLTPAGTPGSVARIVYYFSCDIGMGAVACRDSVPSGDSDYNTFRYFAYRMPHNYYRSPNSECRLPGWWGKGAVTSIPPGGGNADECFTTDVGAGHYDPRIHASCERRAGDGLRPQTPSFQHTDFLCKMEFFYRYGIRVNVNQARGAVSGSVTHRTFALGGGASRMGLSHESIALNGGRPF